MKIIHTYQFGPIGYTDDFQEGEIQDKIKCPECSEDLDSLWYMKAPNIIVEFECPKCHYQHTEYGNMTDNITN